MLAYRQGLCKPRARAKTLSTGFITDDVTIGASPDEVNDRAEGALGS